jgi:hypothetical protein
MPLRCCIVCRAEKSPDLQLQYCAACQSALYCSEACQRQDWRKHKKICKLLNVGHGDLQVRTPNHTRRSIALKEVFEGVQRRFNEDFQRFYKLFEESTFEGSRAAARKMKEFVKRQQYRRNDTLKMLLFHSLQFLARFSDSEMLSWPNSPLLVMLQFLDPNVLNEESYDSTLQPVTPLFIVADLADSSVYTTHKNQLILAKQLIEHGANVNAVSSDGATPLHNACKAGKVTNLDFVELLLEEGADPNFQMPSGLTPLMFTTADAPGAAKFLLNWPTTDVNITTHDHAAFLHFVQMNIEKYSDEIALNPNIPDRVQQQLLLQQWRDVEEMAVEKGAHDLGLAAFE